MEEEWKTKKENSTELQKPNGEEEFYSNNKKCNFKKKKKRKEKAQKLN